MPGVDYQVVVIGGGPAGARTAELLAAQDISVLLLEAGSEQHQVVCGGLLNAQAQVALGIDLPEGVRCKPFAPPLEFHDLDNRIRRSYSPFYHNINRPAFDSWLRERAQQAGAAIRYRTPVKGLSQGTQCLEADTENGLVRCLFAVDATGWRALSRRWFGVESAPRLDTVQGLVKIDVKEDAMWAIYKSSVTPFFGWIIPKGGGRFLLGAGFRHGQAIADLNLNNPWDMLQPYISYFRNKDRTVEKLDDKPRGSPLTWIKSTSQLWWGKNGVFPVGEAAGLVSPSSGDGISYALRSAVGVSRALADEFNGNDAVASRGNAAAVHDGLVRQIKRELAPEMNKLRFSCLRARVAAQPLLRRAGTALLLWHLKRPVEVLRFNG